MPDQKRAWWIPLVTSLITSLAVLAGAWFTFQSDVATSDLTADASRLESAFRRIEYLETEIRNQKANSNGRIVELTSQVFKLQSQLNQDLNIMDMFERFMDGLPFEAWLKEVEMVDGKPVFRMVIINDRYELKYRISRKKYEGSTDSQIWGQETAREFRKNDLQVLNDKASIVVYEAFPVNPIYRGVSKIKIRMLVVKIYLELVDGRQMVFGMAIDPEDIIDLDDL